MRPILAIAMFYDTKFLCRALRKICGGELLKNVFAAWSQEQVR